MNEKALVEKTGDKTNSPEANANAHVGVGAFLAIAAFGIACVALGVSITYPKVYEAKIESVEETMTKIVDAKLNVIQDIATRAENHARTAEQNTQVLKDRLDQEKRNGR